MSSSHADLDRLKLKYVTWYCDKEPHGFVAFMSNCAAVTRSLGFGMEVELYLDVTVHDGVRVDVFECVRDGGRVELRDVLRKLARAREVEEEVAARAVVEHQHQVAVRLERARQRE